MFHISINLPSACKIKAWELVKQFGKELNKIFQSYFGDQGDQIELIHGKENFVSFWLTMFEGSSVCPI